jgi:hypothetical protein
MRPSSFASKQIASKRAHFSAYALSRVLTLLLILTLQLSRFLTPQVVNFRPLASPPFSEAPLEFITFVLTRQEAISQSSEIRFASIARSTWGRPRCFVVLLFRRGVTRLRHTNLGSTTSLVVSRHRTRAGASRGVKLARRSPSLSLKNSLPAGLATGLVVSVSWAVLAAA